jgi:thioredoxin 2
MHSAANAQILRCSKCGTKNRVVPGATGDPVCGRCKTPLTSDVRPIYVTDKNFVEEVERSPLPVLVDFWAAWCGPCRLIAPIVDQLAKELGGRVRIGKLDVDANHTTAARYRVQSIPTMIVFKDGKEVDRIVGVQSKEAIAQRLLKYS